MLFPTTKLAKVKINLKMFGVFYVKLKIMSFWIGSAHIKQGAKESMIWVFQVLNLIIISSRKDISWHAEYKLYLFCPK